MTNSTKPNEALSPKQEIKQLYNKLADKVGFIDQLSEKVERSPLTLQQHWFSRFFNVPIDYQTQVLEELRKEVGEIKEA